MTDLIDQYLEEMKALEATGATLTLRPFRPSEAFTLLRILQWAKYKQLANTPVTPDLQEFAEKLARNIEGRLCKRPAMRQLAANGWIINEAVKERTPAAEPEPEPETEPEPEEPEAEPDPPPKARPVRKKESSKER